MTSKKARTAVFSLLIAMGSASCAAILSIDDISNDGLLGESSIDGSSTPDTNTITPDGSGATDTGSSTTDASDAGVQDSGPDAPVVTPCRRDAGLVDGGCYFVLDDGGTQAEAKARCVTAGGHLVVFETAAEMAFIPVPLPVMWIGLEGKPPSNNKADFRWINDAATPFDGWNATEPNATTGCVILNAAKWSDRACTDTYAALCEKLK